MKNSSYLPTYEDGKDSVSKRRCIKFRRLGITHKKAYNIYVLSYSTCITFCSVRGA